MRKELQGMFKWFALVGFGVSLYVGLQHIDIIVQVISSVIQVFSPFIYGIGIAYLIDTLVRWLNKRWLKGKRGIAILISYILFIAVIVLMMCAIIPQSIQSITSIIENMDYYIEQTNTGLDWVNDRLGTNLSVQSITDIDEQQIDETINEFMQKYSGQVITTGSHIIQITITILTAFAASIYILLDKYKLKRAILRMLYQIFSEEKVDYLCRVGRIFDKQTTNFFVGKVLDSLIIGVLTFIQMAILGLPYQILVQTIVGITNIIPVFGPFIGAVPGILIIFIESPIQALEFAILILIIQQLDGNLIGPKILGQTSNVQAFWILFQIVVGGNVAGVLGMILGVPVFLVVQTLIKEEQDKRLKLKGMDVKIDNTHFFGS